MKPLSGKELIDSLEADAGWLDAVISGLNKLQHVPTGEIKDAVNTAIAMRQSVVKKLWAERAKLEGISND